MKASELIRSSFAHSFSIRFCMIYAYSRPRYQVSVYRTIGLLFFGVGLAGQIETSLHIFSQWKKNSQGQVIFGRTVKPVLSKRPRETPNCLLKTGACLIEVSCSQHVNCN